MDEAVKIWTEVPQAVNLLDGMQNGGVMLAAELSRDLRITLEVL